MNESRTIPKYCWRPSLSLWAVLVLFAMLIIYPFYGTILDMEHRWSGQEEYSYGYIIPFITIFLIWQRKDQLASDKMAPTLWAVPLLLLSGFVYFVGTISTTHTLSQYALVLTILFLAYGLLGWNRFKIVAIPLVLLFFMVPLPPFILNNLSGKLQLISSEIGVAVIRWFDISVYLEGNVIDLGTYKLQVVEACSGLRYLFPLMSLSFIAAYLYNVEIWKRVIVFLSSMPITVLMNSFRIGVIGVLVEYYGIEQAEGFLHDFEGWIIFMACMGILFIEMAVLARVGKNKKKLSDVFAIELPRPRGRSCALRENSVQLIHYAFLATLALYSVSTLYIEERKDIQVARTELFEFPNHIDQWTGKKEKLEENILQGLKTDDYLISNYQNNSGDLINFYIAYYASQEAGSAAHSPRSCIPGGGWKINDLRTITIPEVEINGEPVKSNRLLISKGDVGQLVYYWFQQRGRIITNEYLVKWYLFWDALTRNRTDGALVRITTPVRMGDDLSKADQKLVRFLQQVEPLLPEYIPE